MKNLWHILQLQWQSAPAFRLSLLYLTLLTVLALALPWLPLAYGPNDLDLDQIYQAPFGWKAEADKPRHWLGTDGLGRDVLANILYGARTAFAISLPVMAMASLIGLLLGAMAGLFGNQRLQMSRAFLIALLISLVPLSYYGIYLPIQLSNYGANTVEFILTGMLAIGLSLLLVLVLRVFLRQFPVLKEKSALPADELLLRLIEVQTSIPRLVLILVLAAVAPPTLLALTVLLTLTFWTGTARLARAEMMRIRELPFFEAAISLGYTPKRLLMRHAVPHLMGPVLVAFSFGLAGLLMLESTLSFLNIGVSTDLVSWGRMIAGIRANTAAWWLVAIPGVVLSLTVLALQTFSYYVLQFLQNKK
ncbi:ABC transporter permease [Pontibacter ramchanderi]|uniref:Peptide/nickel transport system permease protein n=1 Tax=Pontibacter ramchanderi TaxID=1179743 RepID=A0A2N3V2I3_9BACT|nr:ABC transporter permease [Pontibacter ramchanderi]PKV75818.1 peptide/nickel transport system permease protein [Pontibacter ramchanderi]